MVMCLGAKHCRVSWHASSMGKCPPSSSLLNSIPSWLGHEGTRFAKVTLLCVSQSIRFPFVYVVLFPGITISGGIEVDFCLSITFSAEIFHSFTSPFQEALWKHPSCSGKVILEGVTALSCSPIQAMALMGCRTWALNLIFLSLSFLNWKMGIMVGQKRSCESKYQAI